MDCMMKKKSQTKEYISYQKGKCLQCGDYDTLFFDDDGELLCSDCIFENECDKDFFANGEEWEEWEEDD